MLTKIIDEETLREAKSCIDEGESFVIVAHVAPDGDALGSTLALRYFLEAYGKKNVKVIFPNEYPSFYAWMPGVEDILLYEKDGEQAERLIKAADVVCCLDINDVKRTDWMAPYVSAAKGRKVLIDHHLEPVMPCRVKMSYPDMSSTSEIVFRLIWQLGMMDMMTKEMAECIYTGMMTDTGSFTYNSNHPEIYTIIGELIRRGIDKDQIYRNVYQVYSESRLRMQGYVLYNKMKIYPEHHAALITLSNAELDRFHYRTGDTEGFVNLPLSIEGISFSCFIRRNKGYTKVSLRSVGDFPCHTFAAKYFNGGGHKNASGGQFDGSVKDAIAAFEKALKEFDPDENTEEKGNHA